MIFDLNKIDWTAISAIGTFLAVIVALLIPFLLRYLTLKSDAVKTRRKFLPYIFLINKYFELSQSNEHHKAEIAFANFFSTHKTIINTIESIFIESNNLTDEEQKVIGYLLSILRDQVAQEMIVFDSIVAKTIYEMTSSIMQMFARYNVKIFDNTK